MDPDVKRRKVLFLLLSKKREAKRSGSERKWWVRPIYLNRQDQGAQQNLINEMRLQDTESFFNFFRMTPQKFDELLSVVGPRITMKATSFRNPISAQERKISYYHKLTIINNEWEFPNCIGAVDGKHIVMQAPNSSGSAFFNYKGSFSIVLLAACDGK
ncbi:uncharacterized protein LOC118197725, partial [Stegodyphus dumicola]|uniref:uncharacterized protein LOC118197725 n=1 Tax=Stegodyphus dumicola TaxID=202533 RepID=UPI0015AF64FF